MQLRRRDLLATGAAFSVGGLLSRALPAASPAAAVPAIPPPLVPPERGARLLEQAWRFHRGDVPMPKIRGHRPSFDATKAGNAIGAAALSYDDASWEKVDLPHDWAIERPPVESENLSQGYRERGYAWYRRTFRLEEERRGRYLELQFGAIATNATIWVNGTEMAHNWSGYNGINIDITTLAQFGSALNAIAVRVDAERFEGWWYEGAGPYRHVWLIDRAPVHIATDGVHADPRVGSDGRWRIPVEATLYSIEERTARVRVVSELRDANGRILASAGSDAVVPPLRRTAAKFELAGFDPRLWSVDDPALYSVRTRIERAGAILDERITPCGFRTLRFDAQQGFFLNGRHLKLKGACIHQDHAGVGVAVPDALVWWRVQQLKAMGCNAIRSSHNAPSPALLDACDALGMLLMNENRQFNVAPDYIQQLEWLVRRDRNRPSVFMWSVFNEEPMQGTPAGYQMVRRMADVVKQLDDSRPVTAAMSGGMFTPVNVSQAVDVVGFNYQQDSYDRFHKENPALPLISSEDTSAFITRGEWKKDPAAHIQPSDDSERANWGNTHRRAWKEIDTRPFVAGAFLWTGFDYHGEPTPHAWPTKNSFFGAMDLCGFRKSAFYIHQAQWMADRPILKILPHWNWQAGDEVKVMIATNVDRVELFLNGRKVGEGPVDRYEMITLNIPFAAGRLEARGWRGGRLIATDFVETTGYPVSLRLTPSRARLIGDGADAVPVTIEALDSRGRAVPTAGQRVDLAVKGGRLIGVGNGDPNSPASGKERHVRLFNGLAQAIVQSDRGSRGTLSLRVSADTLRPAHIALRVVPGNVPAIGPGPMRIAVTGWRQSTLTPQAPARPEAISDFDMNSWAAVTPGLPPPFSPAVGFVTFAATIAVPARVVERGGHLLFESITGQGVLWLNGAKVAEKREAESGPLRVRIPPGTKQLNLALVLEASPSRRTGLPGVVLIEFDDAAASA